MRVAGMIAVVACGSTPAPGLVGAVGTGAPLTDVELFVGNAQSAGSGGCFGQAGIGPNVGSGNQCFDGSGWTNASPAAQYESATGNVTWFQLMPNGQPVPALLVVGYDGDTPVEAAVVHDVPVGNTPVQIVMQPIDDLLAQGSGITVWRRPTDQRDSSGHFTESACAAIGDAQSGVEFFVPADDTDCDGATKECPGNDFNYCFSGPPRGRASFTCLAEPAGHGTACRLAGHGCSENGPACQGSAVDPNACTAIEDFKGCVPREFCEGGLDTTGSAAGPCDQLDTTCFTADHFANEIHVQCVFAVQVGVGGDLVACGDTQPVPAELQFQTGDAVVGAETCQDAVMYGLASPLQKTDHIDIPTTVLPNMMGSLRVDASISNCDVSVSYEGQGFPQIVLDGEIHGDAIVEAHTTSEQHRIVPLDVKFTGCGSGDASSCAVVPTQPSTPLACP